MIEPETKFHRPFDRKVEFAGRGKIEARNANVETDARVNMGDGAALGLQANLSANEVARRQGEPIGRPIWGGETGERLRPWSVFWRLETP